MATCPRCREFLDDDHVCRGASGRAVRWALVTISTGLVGLMAGGLIFGLLGDALHIDELASIGMVVGPTTAFVFLRAFRLL